MVKKIPNYKFISYLDLNTEVKGRYISEVNYEADMKKIVEPFLGQYKKCGYLCGKEELKLYYEKYAIEECKGAVVIFHGFGEFTEKYNELIYYFINENYSVFIMEHRGNSRSERLGKDSCQINIECFDNYIEDIKKFLDDIVLPITKNKKLLAFAHSMGGGIASAFMEKYTQYFQGAVLSSPMHKINTGKYPRILASSVSRTLTIVGKGNEYLPGQKPYTGNRKFPSRSTSSENRYNYQYNLIKNNENYQTGGAGAKWYLEAFKATKRIIKKKNASKVKIPIIIFECELDTHVLPEGHYKFAKNARECNVIIIRGAKHESFFESDNITFHVVDKILEFYNNIV